MTSIRGTRLAMKSGSEVREQSTGWIHVLASLVDGSVATLHTKTEGAAGLLDQIRHQTVIIINSLRSRNSLD